MILIIGNARSGTSWLGKIFDSHPDVVYRHEPDSSIPTRAFPFFVEPAEFDAFEAAAADYLHRLRRSRTIRSVGRPPFFDKSFHASAARHARIAIIEALRMSGRLPLVGRTANALDVPDLMRGTSEVRYVVKSVVSLGRAGLYRRAMGPEGRLIFIVRHPCAVVASQLRGQRLGKISHETPFETISSSSVGQRHGLSPARLRSMPVDEQIAWIWLVMNEKALEDVTGAENAAIVTHEGLCLAPLEESRRLFGFCGLTWNGQTQAFLERNASSDRTPAYYDVERNPAGEIDKWKSELPPEIIRRVESVLERSPLAELFSGPAPAGAASAVVSG